MSAGPFRLAILISGRGSNMIAIARACLAGSIPARVAVVISDRADAAGLAGAAALGIETATVLQPQGGGGSAFERSLAGALQKHQPDMIALAGFMRILTGRFVDHYLGRMLNIHPSLLPAYRGLHTHARLLAAGDTQHGATLQVVATVPSVLGLNVAAADELKPFEASYAWIWHGMTVATSTLKLEKTGDTWTYSSHSEPRGVGKVFPERPTQKSVLRVTDAGTQPLS